MFSRKVNTANTGNEIASCRHTSRLSHHRTILGGVLFTAVIVLLAAACDPIQGSGAGNPPDPAKYIHVDDASRAVIVTLVAAYPATDFQFNYDGYGSGSLVLTVPAGWQVTVQCENRGTVPNSCSVVSDEKATQPMDPSWTTPDLAPGSSATFSFTPTAPGSYRIASLVDGHEASGMWLDLEVVASGRPKLEAPGG
jgi:Sulfocyanin (SoxE) domain